MSNGRWREVHHKQIRKLPKRWTLSQIFYSSRAFQPPKQTYVEKHVLGFMELLVLLRSGAFLFEERVICWVTSGQRWMKCSALTSFYKEWQRFRIISLNCVRKFSKSAQETEGDTFEVGKLCFKLDHYLHDFFYDRWHSHTILYIHKLSHTRRTTPHIGTAV